MSQERNGHVLTEDEQNYIRNDVVIMSKALNYMFKQKLTKMTSASNSISNYRDIIGKTKFNHYFPKLSYELDHDLRQAYKGGFTYANPIYKEKEVGEGVVLDVNSLYPSVLYEKEMPFGKPLFYKGKYKDDRVFPLYIQRISCSFKIKKNHIPTIQIKNRKSMFRSNEYLTSSNGEVISLTLTNIDLKLFLDQYDVEDLEYECGWKFKSIKGLFKDYIDKWIEIKIQATKTGNKGLRTIAKLMLNSLYGKFASSMDLRNKYPFMTEDGVIHYRLSEPKQKDGIYIPVGVFTTSYAREKTIRTAQAITDYSLKKYGKDLFCYSDTDSIHSLLPIEELKLFCEIDDVKLGAWKHESSFERAKFIRAKTYLEYFDGEMNITCAGMPKSCYKNVTWENFKVGLTVPRETYIFSYQRRSIIN